MERWIAVVLESGLTQWTTAVLVVRAIKDDRWTISRDGEVCKGGRG
jgi:hypothetical protein